MERKRYVRKVSKKSSFKEEGKKTCDSLDKIEEKPEIKIVKKE